MKLESYTTGNVVDYYPVKFVDGTILTEWFLRVVSFEGVETTSKKFLRKKDAFDEVNDRIIAEHIVDVHRRRILDPNRELEPEDDDQRVLFVCLRVCVCVRALLAN